MHFKVLVTRLDYPKEAMDLLIKEGCELIIWNKPGFIPKAELLARLKEGMMNGLFCNGKDNIDKDVIDAGGSTLKVISTSCAGYNHIDLAEATKKGIKVGHTPNLVTDATAELTVALLLATSRRLLEGYHEIINGNWVWTSTFLIGRGLKGSTVGIFGLGRIGQAVVERLIPFGVSRFVYSGRSEKPDVAAEFVSFNTLLTVSDFIIVTAALTQDTKEIFDETAFSKMKPSAIFINTSRGGLVQQSALITALKTGQIWAAGLDVMSPEPLPKDHELTKLKNCGKTACRHTTTTMTIFIWLSLVLIPHIGTALIEVRTAMAVLSAQNIIAGLYDEEIPARVPPPTIA